MRKILLLVIAFLMVSCTCLAAGTKVCVIADIPMVLKNDKAVLAEIDTNVRKVFRPYKFDITPSLEETLLHLRQYRQDNGLIAPNGGGAFLKTKDVQNIGNLLKADYVFHIEAFPQGVRGKVSVFSARIKYDAVCNLKVLNVRTGEFVIVKQFTESGDTGTSKGKMIKHFAEFVPRSIANSKLDVSGL